MAACAGVTKRKRCEASVEVGRRGDLEAVDDIYEHWDRAVPTPPRVDARALQVPVGPDLMLWYDCIWVAVPQVYYYNVNTRIE